AREGWWGADLHAQRQGDELPLMAAAEGLHLVTNVVWRWDGTKWQATDQKVRRPIAEGDPYAAGREFSPSAAIFESPGGALLFVAARPLDWPPIALSPGATGCHAIAAARQAGIHVVAGSATARELPLWVTLGEVDMVMLLGGQSEGRTAAQSDPKG